MKDKSAKLCKEFFKKNKENLKLQMYINVAKKQKEAERAKARKAAEEMKMIEKVSGFFYSTRYEERAFSGRENELVKKIFAFWTIKTLQKEYKCTDGVLSNFLKNNNIRNTLETRGKSKLGIVTSNLKTIEAMKEAGKNDYQMLLVILHKTNITNDKKELLQDEIGKILESPATIECLKELRADELKPVMDWQEILRKELR